MKEPGRTIALALMGALLAGHAVQAAATTVNPGIERLYAFRADHMMLDAAVIGPRVLVATQSGHVDAYDWRGGKTGGPLNATMQQADSAFPPTVTAVAVSPSGALCAVVSSDGVLEFHRAADERFEDPVSRLQLPQVLTARFLDDDRGEGLLALPLEEHQVGVLRIADGRILRRFGGHTGPIQFLFFADGGERLISAGNDAWVFVWDLSDKSKGELQ